MAGAGRHPQGLRGSGLVQWRPQMPGGSSYLWALQGKNITLGWRWAAAEPPTKGPAHAHAPVGAESESLGLLEPSQGARVICPSTPPLDQPVIPRAWEHGAGLQELYGVGRFGWTPDDLPKIIPGGDGARGTYTLHTPQETKSQETAPSRIQGLPWGSEGQEGGASQNARGTQPKQRKAGLGWARGHPSRVLLSPRTCLPCTQGTVQGLGCKPCPGQAGAGRPAWLSKRGSGQQCHCPGMCQHSDPLPPKLGGRPSYWSLNKPPGDSDVSPTPNQVRDPLLYPCDAGQVPFQPRTTPTTPRLAPRGTGSESVLIRSQGPVRTLLMLEKHCSLLFYPITRQPQSCLP